MSKDYYKILGVTEFDTTENIKLAYRKLARKWHPDVAGNNPDVISRFKEINEAYEILSNKVRKEEYDKARRFYSYAKKTSDVNNAGRTTTESKTETSKQFSFNWKDFIHKKNREDCYREKHQESVAKNGEDVYADIEITVFEALSGVIKTVNMLQKSVCPKCKGRKFINGSTCVHCHGKGEFVNYKKFNVKVPAGIKNKSKIRLAGEGAYGVNGGKSGDLYITVNIKEEQHCKTEGLNIIKNFPITPFEAVLGAEVKINTLKGILNVKIPANTQNGQKIRLSGCGLVQNDKIGDMILSVEIRIPSNLTTEELSLYKKLKEISTGNIRDNIYDR